MIEVLFGESEAGSMKVAKNTIMTDKMPGTSEEVICLAFMLDVGDIKEALDSPYRKNLIFSLYSQDQWGKDPEMDADLQKAADLYVNEMNRLKKYLKNGEKIRIWYSDAPYSRCGFYHLCSILENSSHDVRAVRLPEYQVKPGSIVSYHSWGDVAPEEFAAFLSHEKSLSKEELRMYAFLWGQLKEENSYLRAVVNGRVVSVPENHYDFLIWKKLTEKPIVEARLIGEILGSYPIGIGDWWYSKRISHFIEQGRIKVLRDSEKLYERTICLS